MTTYFEQTKWRKFLHPVVTGLVALMAAGTMYLSLEETRTWLVSALAEADDTEATV